MTFQINPPGLLIVVFLCLSIFLIIISYKKFFHHNEVVFIAIIRFLILLSLITLIYNPTIEIKGNIKKSLPWHIYIDNSLSIKYHTHPSSIAYKNGLKSFFNKIKNKKVEFDAFSFGSSLDTVNDISNLGLDANSTNFGLIYDHINDNYQKKLDEVIIFTDGQINQGPLIQEFYEKNNSIPLNIIGVGDTTPMLDVSIKSIEIPPLVMKGANVNIDVIVSSIGQVKERLNVNLFDENNRLIGSKLITISGEESNELIRFQINPKKIGENKFFVKCSALSDEINIQNNQQKITLLVIKDLYNIALVTGAPSFNTKAIKNYLGKQGNNKLDHFLINDNNFNQNIKEFLEKKYELIIFDNNPVSLSARKWDSVVRVFAKKLISHNSSFLIIPGPEVDIASLNKYLNIIDFEAEGIFETSSNNLRWQFLSNWFDLLNTNKKTIPMNQLSSYPPQIPAFKLSDKYQDKKERQFASYLNDDFKSPLLVLGEKKQVRFAIWNSIDLASFKNMLINSESNFLFDNFMRNITDWLMKKNDSSEFIFRTNKNSYQHGELVLLSGIPSDLNDDLKIKEGFVELYQNGNYISTKPLFFDLNEKLYKSKFWAPKPGDIQYVVNINSGIESYEVSQGFFKVQESHIELNKIFLNENKLKNLSESSGGSFKYWENKDDLIERMNIDYFEENYISTYKIRYNYFFMGFIVILLFFEWFYRKRSGFL